MSEETPEQVDAPVSEGDDWVDESVEESWATDEVVEVEVEPSEPIEPDVEFAPVDEVPLPDEPTDPADLEPDPEPEHLDDLEVDDPEPAVAREPWEPTGHAEVDEVLASLDVLDGLSVHEHVPVFEDAHRALRRALDGAAQDGPA